MRASVHEVPTTRPRRAVSAALEGTGRDGREDMAGAVVGGVEERSGGGGDGGSGSESAAAGPCRQLAIALSLLLGRFVIEVNGVGAS